VLSLGHTQYAAGKRYESREYDGVPYTIDDMRRLVRDALTREQSPELRRLVESIIAQVEAKDYLSEIAAIYYYVLKNVRYVRDPLHTEYTQHPYLVLQPETWDRADGRRGRQVDCEEMATTLAAMVMAIGNTAEFVTITTDASRGFHHVFTVVKVGDGRRIVLDPVPGPNTTEMIHSIARYQAWPIEPVRRPSVAGWQPAAIPMGRR
jgi:hypothetical protein